MPVVDNIFHYFQVQDVYYLADRVSGGDPADVRVRAATCDQAGATLDRAAADTDSAANTLFRSWSGDAADSARRALATAADHRLQQGRQLHDSARALSTVASALEIVQETARDCVERSHRATDLLNSVLGRAADIVTAASPVLAVASYVTEQATGVDLQEEATSFLVANLPGIKQTVQAIMQDMTTALAAYEKVLRNEAETLRAMKGVVRLNAGPIDLPGDAELRRGALFRAVYGRDPVSPGDLTMAQALDAQGSDAGNTQSNANVTVIRIDPVPGGGVVRGAAFIQEPLVLNPVYKDFLNHGDGRGFDPSAGPDDARMSFDIDYETGVVVVRQNASTTVQGESVTGYPQVGVEQDGAGRVRLRVEGTDPFADPATWATGTSVRADLVVDPHGGQSAAEVSGKTSQFPSWEMYQDRDGQTGAPLLQQDEHASGFERAAGLGPLLNVGRPTQDVGPDPSALPDWRERYHPGQHGNPDFLADVQNSLPPPFSSVGSKITDDFYDYPVQGQPYPSVDSSGRLTIPSADQVR